MRIHLKKNTKINDFIVSVTRFCVRELRSTLGNSIIEKYKIQQVLKQPRV